VGNGAKKENQNTGWIDPESVLPARGAARDVYAVSTDCPGATKVNMVFEFANSARFT
jgi:hypothetical protein